MRIVAGRWRGRPIREPHGRQTTRPTTDRVREALASMVDSALPGGIEDARVLDAFAGTGALGIEMLSRGASFCTFFDCDRGAAALVRSNLESLECERDRYRVLQADVCQRAAAGNLAGPFDLLLIDPPYAHGPAPAETLIGSLLSAGALSPGAVAVVERDSAAPAARPCGIEPARTRRFGGTSLDLYRFDR